MYMYTQKKLYWTTVAHVWGDSEETVMKKCELSLVTWDQANTENLYP